MAAWTRCLSFLCACSCVVACGPKPQSSERSTPKSLFSDPAFTQATRARAIRLTHRATHSGPEEYWGMVPVGSPKALTEAQAESLVSLLREAEKTDGKELKGCDPIPGVAVEFPGANGVKTVLICLECDMYGVGDGKRPSWGDFDPLHSRVEAWVNEVFPPSQKKK